ncbi:TlpA family protein disulfide reductase [bacterium]|nr:TlpA family protein disulfide reductase [bacterium]
MGSPKKILFYLIVVFLFYLFISDGEFTGGVRGFFADMLSITTVGTEAPNISTNDIYGRSVSLEAFRGQVAILTFWTSWCSACKWQMPKTQQTYTESKYRGYKLVTVNLDEESEAYVKNYVANNGYTFPVIHDKSHILAKKYGVSGYPTTFIIGRDGVIVKKISGDVDFSEKRYSDILKEILNKK